MYALGMSLNDAECLNSEFDENKVLGTSVLCWKFVRAEIGYHWNPTYIDLLSCNLKKRLTFALVHKGVDYFSDFQRSFSDSQVINYVLSIEWIDEIYKKDLRGIPINSRLE